MKWYQTAWNAVKSAWKWLISALETTSKNGGGLSSKRVYGFVCLAVGIALAFQHADAALVAIFMGSASAVFIAQAASGT
jgi:hypothetical protein